jgi:hypothetical protein
MTHISNIPHILRHGITHAESPNANPSYTAIGDVSLIRSREDFLLDNGRFLGEAIPFYFWYRMPMLYVIQKGYNNVPPRNASEIVYCITTVQKIVDLQLDFIFTDGHAVDSFSRHFTSDKRADLDTILDWEAIKNPVWKDEDDQDRKR